MNNIVPKDKGSKWISAICAVLVTVGLSVNLGAKSESFSGFYKLFNNMVVALSSYNISRIFTVVLFYFLFLYGIGLLKKTENLKREIVCAGLPALLFGIFMAIGYSFKSKGNWSLVFGNVVQLLKSGLYSLGYTILFFFGIVILFRALDQVNIYHTEAVPGGRHKCIRWYLKCLEQKTFLTAFLTLLICYVPYMVLSYPGILMGDSYNQITQAYNIETYSTYFDLISDEVKLNNHHPVVHTMLIHVCLRIGGLFHNYSFGLGLYSLLQTVFVLVVLAWIFSFLKELGISIKIILVLMLYYILHPRIASYMYLLTKDIISTAFLMVFFITLYRIFLGQESKKIYGFLAGSMIGALLFRNDGIYIVLLTVIGLIIFHKKYRKKFCMAAVGILAFHFLWNSVLLPGLQITSSGRRDVLSIPFQQTARYIRDAGEEVTEREKEAINAVLAYDKLAAKYNPTSSDPVKATFREKTATTTDLVNYFKVWLEMLMKHPEIYIQATLHHKYDMFYFDSGKANNYSYSWSAEQMESVNKLSDDILEVQLNYPKSLEKSRDWYENLREGLFSLPLINLLMVAAVYINGFIIFIFYGIRTRSKLIITMGFPVFVQLLLIVAGPCNATYFRYVYPIAMILPFMVLLGLHVNRQGKEEKEVLNGTKE